jgi:hypothetical protein
MKPASTDTPSPAWYWAIPIAFLLPILHISIFTIRFGFSKFVGALIDGLIFIPGGLIASITLVYLLRLKISSPSNLVAGFIAGVPFAFLFSLLLPLFWPAIVGATIGVAFPLLLGLGLGHFYKPRTASAE